MTGFTGINLFGHSSNLNDLDDTFTYNNINLKTVDTFAYLGVEQNASSALYMIKKGLLRNRDFAIKPATALTLFHMFQIL